MYYDNYIEGCEKSIVFLIYHLNKMTNPILLDVKGKLFFDENANLSNMKVDILL